MDGAPVKVD